MSTSRVAVFSTKACTFCSRVKSALNTRSIPFVEIDVDKHPAAYESAAAHSGIATVPVVYVDGKCVGGSVELLALLESTSELPEVDQLEEWPSFLIIDESKTADDGVDALYKEFVAVFDPVVDCGIKTQKHSEWTAVLRKALPLTVKSTMFGICNVRLNCCGGKALMEQLLRPTWVGVDAPVETDVANTVFDSLARSGVLYEVEHEDKSGALSEDNYLRKLLALEDGAGPACFSPSGVYRLFDDHPSVVVLNSRFPAGTLDEASRHSVMTVDFVHALRQEMAALLDVFMDGNGLVDYEAMRVNTRFKQFDRATAALQLLDLTQLSTAERTVVMLNVYNMGILHALAWQGPPEGIVARYRFFSGTGYVIGGRFYSFNAMENGVLRSNRRSPLPFSDVPFPPTDPRVRTILPVCDHRIHFALNCGATSCPPIKVFSLARLDEEMFKASRGFVQSTTHLKDDTLHVSTLMQWYRPDFGDTDEEVIRTLTPYFDENLKKGVMAVGPAKLKLRYNEYDWSTNAKSQR